MTAQVGIASQKDACEQHTEIAVFIGTKMSWVLSDTNYNS
jgi:hypothetical protein